MVIGRNDGGALHFIGAKRTTEKKEETDNVEF